MTSSLIGGLFITEIHPYAATVSPVNYSVTQVSINTGGIISSVALNEQGVGFIGGADGNLDVYAAFFSTTRELLPLSGLPTHGLIQAVSLNGSNQALIGGAYGPAPTTPYAALASLNLNTPAPIALSIASGEISNVALNDSNLGLIGGDQIVPSSFGRYAAFISSGIEIPIPLGPPALDKILAVALSDAPIGLIGGQEGPEPFASFVSLNIGTQIPSSLPLDLPSGNGSITSVALTNFITGLIGGEINDSAYAAFVTRDSLVPTSISGLPSMGTIEAVALNDLSQGLIGGFDANTNLAYAAFVSQGDPAMPLSGLPIGQIDAVAINHFRQGIIAGRDNTDPSFNIAYAALVLPSGLVTRLPIEVGQGLIASVAVNTFFLSQLPTEGLHGNNLLFADYINAYAPQDVFYFIPSLLDGSFNRAIASSAPTRNMISFNTVLQNTFYLTTNLSAHLRNQWLISARAPISEAKPVTDQSVLEDAGETLLAGPLPSDSKPSSCKPKTVSLWFDAIGALASQDAQQETPGFAPATGGGTCAFDVKGGPTWTYGCGASYFFTHVHEKGDQGRSNIQQEDLFFYVSWMPKHFTFDLGLWGGLFQTRQTRNIHLSGFSSQVGSKPHGWQLVPHLELGWIDTIRSSAKSEVLWNLLGMVDWANGWQNKYSETGNSPFKAHQKAHYGSLLRSEGGVRFSEIFFFPTWNLILQEKGSYVNFHSFNAGRMQAFLVGSPGSFTLQTLTSSQHLGLVQASIAAAPHKGSQPTSMLLYQGEFGSGYQSHELNLEFSWNF